ncbi:hypothetical protein HG530_009175 [Fusarium avenaceum]|nr:hypothetical protein HG530_009175 [Fusarium avenaceum]
MFIQCKNRYVTTALPPNFQLAALNHPDQLQHCRPPTHPLALQLQVLQDKVRIRNRQRLTSTTTQNHPTLRFHSAQRGVQKWRVLKLAERPVVLSRIAAKSDDVTADSKGDLNSQAAKIPTRRPHYNGIGGLKRPVAPYLHELLARIACAAKVRDHDHDIGRIIAGAGGRVDIHKIAGFNKYGVWANGIDSSNSAGIRDVGWLDIHMRNLTSVEQMGVWNNRRCEDLDDNCPRDRFRYREI